MTPRPLRPPDDVRYLIAWVSCTHASTIVERPCGRCRISTGHAVSAAGGADLIAFTARTMMRLDGHPRDPPTPLTYAHAATLLKHLLPEIRKQDTLTEGTPDGPARRTGPDPDDPRPAGDGGEAQD